MKTRETQYEPALHLSPSEVYAELGYSEKRRPTVEGVLATYVLLPKIRRLSDSTPRHDLHHAAIQYVLGDALVSFKTDMSNALSASRVRNTQLQLIKNEFNGVKESAKKVNFIPEVLKPISNNFIDFALNYDKYRPEYLHTASLEVGFALGDTKILDAKLHRVERNTFQAESNIQKSPHNEAQVARAIFARTVLRQYGRDVNVTLIPSVLEVVTQYTRSHVPSIAAASTAVMIAGTLLSPTTAARANEPTIRTIQTSQSSSQGNEKSITIAPSVGTPDSPPQPLTSPSVPETQQPITVGVSSGQKTETAPKAQRTIIEVSAPVDAPKPTISVAPDVDKSTKSTPQIIPLTPDMGGANPETNQAILIAPPSELPLAVAPDNSNSLPNGSDSINVIIPMAPETTTDPSAPDQATLTPGQKKVQVITDTLNHDGDISNAFSEIVKFGVTKQTDVTDKNGNKIPTTTNAPLFDNVKTLGSSYKDLIAASGHSDLHYINTSLMAFAVLEAASKDQTVLDSKEVRGLVSGITAPTDAYQLRLFNQYLAIAKTTLETNNNGELIAGFDSSTDPNVVNHKAIVETLYTYALMADTTDLDQSSKIQVMKDADIKAAAEAAAAKAAAEAAAKAAGAETAPGQILETAINQAAIKYGWSNNKKIILLVAAQHGASAAAVAGLGGNVFAESGFNPSAIERGSGAGRGYIQESFGRRQAMERAAAAQGADVNDPTWQANYIMNESKQRTQRRNSGVSEWAGFIILTDPVAAADYWLFNNERAGIPHSAIREAKATELYNQINGEVVSIQADITAKTNAEAAAKAEAERNNHMSKGQDIKNELANKHENGKMSNNALVVLDSPNIVFNQGEDNLNSDYHDQIRHFEKASLQLHPEAARQLIKLADAYQAKFNTPLTLNAAYRSFPVQQDQRQYWKNLGKAKNAAYPGYSNHGWGLAVDIQVAGTAAHRWLVANAATFGWVWPNAAGELWHFEYMGSAAQANDTNSPEPGLK